MLLLVLMLLTAACGSSGYDCKNAEVAGYYECSRDGYELCVDAAGTIVDYELCESHDDADVQPTYR